MYKWIPLSLFPSWSQSILHLRWRLGSNLFTLGDQNLCQRKLTLVKRTGAVSKSEMTQTTRTARRQLLIVQTDRERIGNTITMNLRIHCTNKTLSTLKSITYLSVLPIVKLRYYRDQGVKKFPQTPTSMQLTPY